MASTLKKGKDSTVPKPLQKSRKKQAAEKKESQGRQLTNEDWNNILDWMEISGNSMKIEGSENAPPVGGKMYTKMQGYREMVSYLNAQPRNQSKEVEDIDANSMKDRWPYFFKKYKQLKKESLGTGYGVDPATDGLDITDIESKLCRKMPQYKCMDALFGQLPRILEQSREMMLHGMSPTHIDESPIHVSSDDQMSFGFREGGPEGDGGFQTHASKAAPLSIDWDLQQDVPSNVPETDSQWGEGAGRDGSSLEHRSPQMPITPNATGSMPHSPSVQEGGSTQYSTPPGPQDGPATQNSTPPRPPNLGSTPGTGNLKKWKIANVGDVYPKAKQISETRHSINSAFAMNLGDMTAVRRTANEITKAKYAADMDLKMAQFEEQKHVQQLKELHDDEERVWIREKDQEDRKERLLDRDEKAKDREEKSKTDYQNFMVSLIVASGGSMDKLAELEKMFGSFKR